MTTLCDLGVWELQKNFGFSKKTSLRKRDIRGETRRSFLCVSWRPRTRKERGKWDFSSSLFPCFPYWSKSKLQLGGLVLFIEKLIPNEIQIRVKFATPPSTCIWRPLRVSRHVSLFHARWRAFSPPPSIGQFCEFVLFLFCFLVEFFLLFIINVEFASNNIW